MSESLESILNGAPAPEPEAAPEPAEPAAPAATETPSPETDEETPAGAQVPVSALQAERQQRRDWKEKALRAEGETAELRRQLEEARKAPVQQPQPAAPQVPRRMPSPVEDPEAFVQAQELARFNDRLEITEDLLRDKEGDEAVDAAVATFKTMVAADPSLADRLRAERNPYRWMFQTVKRAEAAKEIGPDPAAWREKERERIRAELAAQTQEPAQKPAPVTLPQSLGTARSAAPRSAPAWTGPTSLEDILAPRK